jgi:hypothetical protein
VREQRHHDVVEDAVLRVDQRMCLDRDRVEIARRGRQAGALGGLDEVGDADLE